MEQIRSLFAKLTEFGNRFSTQDYFLLFLRAWAAKIFYQSGRTKAAAIDTDPELEVDQVIEALKGASLDDSVVATIQENLDEEETYYVSDIVDTASELFPDAGVAEKFQQQFEPSFGDHVSAFFSINDSTTSLFEDEYGIDYIDPEFMGQLALYAETFLPLMILFGIGARLGAFGLLGMTLFIQILVYPGMFADHATWFAALLPIALLGAGKLSFDNLLIKGEK
ncbi:DoxX family protein [Kordiimonas laminariae]|uniref:DoxX family protein n=1 Tax=Kordiimonas laminariae TaxID=2917717 RepID=UPI001FF20BDB|nr:DoxX family protein [Kordiimonas laminariae]